MLSFKDIMCNKRSIKTRAWLRLAHLRWMVESRHCEPSAGAPVSLCGGLRSASAHTSAAPCLLVADLLSPISYAFLHLGLVIEGSNSQWGQSVLAPWLWSFSSVSAWSVVLKLTVGDHWFYSLNMKSDCQTATKQLEFKDGRRVLLQTKPCKYLWNSL